jgi:hypothetical protein
VLPARNGFGQPLDRKTELFMEHRRWWRASAVSPYTSDLRTFSLPAV